MESCINLSKAVFIEKNTDRLYIRSYTSDDYEDCLSLYSNPVLTRFFDHGKPRTKTQIDAYLKERGDYFFQKGLPFGLFSVFLKNNGTFIGQIDVVPTGEPGEVEIGWIFLKEFQNRGYCSESVISFLIPLIKELVNDNVEVAGKIINRIIATAHPENKASQRIMIKAGLSYYKKGLRYGGNPRNWYELTLGNQNLTKASQIVPTWKPEVYSKLSFAQDNAALKILEILKIEKDACILDVGCGDGKISANLSKIANMGSVLGIDKSNEMIGFANNTYKNDDYQNLKFSVQDAQNIDFHESFDLVFSSFALQWFKDKNLFFRKAHEALRENGVMCAIIPLGISQELERATKIVTEHSNWHEFFKDFHPNWYFVDGNNLLHLVMENCFDITYSSTYTQDVIFSSLEDFEEYVLLWYPYLKPLREDLRASFFSKVISEYCKLLPPNKDGSISMKIPIISLIAKKVNL